jgi:hypothetical protein
MSDPAIMHNPSQRASNFRLADNTLGAHGVASSSNSTRPAHFVGGVLNTVGPRIARHVIEIRSALRNFGARQVRWHFGRNPPQLRIEPQAGFPRRRNLCRQKRPSEPSPTHFVHRLPDGEVVASLESEIRKRPSFSLSARKDSVVRGANSTRFALTRPAKSSTCSTVSRASSASLIFRPSPRSLEAPLTAQLRLSEAEADATCERQRNRAGEAVLAWIFTRSSRLTF